MAEKNLFLCFLGFGRIFNTIVLSIVQKWTWSGWVIMSIGNKGVIIVAYDSKDHGFLRGLSGKTIYQKEKYQNFIDWIIIAWNIFLYFFWF